MIEFLRNWVMNIVTLVTFIVLLEVLIPSGKIKKFINLVSGFIILIALLNPVIGLFGKEVNLKEFQISNSNFIDRKIIENNSKVLKDQQMKDTVTVYKAKVVGQIKASMKDTPTIALLNTEVIMNEDYNSKTFGEIKKIVLTIKKEDKSNTIKQVTSIEKVEIGKATENMHKNGTAILNTAIRNDIEDKISKLLELKKENIQIIEEKS